jgi:alkylation response protein AidB-like acyl-CoA dehydrogenase
VNFDNCRIPAENLVNREGEGFRIAMSGLDGGRLNIGACSLGGASFALDQAKTYMETRNQFGRALKDFQALQFKIADMATELEASG